MKTIYKSTNGYTGVMYGEKSLSIFDKNNKEVFHTGIRGVNTFRELKQFVDGYPKFLEMLRENWDKLRSDDEDSDI